MLIVTIAITKLVLYAVIKIFYYELRIISNYPHQWTAIIDWPWITAYNRLNRLKIGWLHQHNINRRHRPPMWLGLAWLGLDGLRRKKVKRKTNCSLSLSLMYVLCAMCTGLYVAKSSFEWANLCNRITLQTTGTSTFHKKTFLFGFC